MMKRMHQLRNNKNMTHPQTFTSTPPKRGGHHPLQAQVVEQ